WSRTGCAARSPRPARARAPRPPPPPRPVRPGASRPPRTPACTEPCSSRAPDRSERRGAAFAAEPRAALGGAAVAAELLRRLRRGQRVTAALAELPAAALLPAGRAQPGGLVPVVDIPGPVLALDLLVQLVHLRRGLHPGDLLVQPGRAGRAQAPLGVPAHLLAHPLAAAVALVEER